jgi:hypothetical protein
LDIEPHIKLHLIEGDPERAAFEYASVDEAVDASDGYTMGLWLPRALMRYVFWD